MQFVLGGGFGIDATGGGRLLAAVRVQLENVFASWAVPPAVMDDLWAGAWWHLGTTFFRQALLPWRGQMAPLLHLRLRLDEFAPSASQQRVRHRNRDLRVNIRPAAVDDERRDLFDRHKERFREGIPNALDDFLGPAPAVMPVPAVEFNVFAGDELVAVSYLARGETAVASLYGFFAPEFSSRSLGLYTMLLEIAYARELGCRHYYPGYALVQASSMDYKKRFHGLEAYDWQAGWQPFARLERGTAPAHVPGSFTIQLGGLPEAPAVMTNDE